jgi:N-acetyl-anhydromuramyl-L-alanine amidase AmpD
MQVAIQTYTEPDDPKAGRYTNFPHYVLDGGGQLVQIADERERARHVAITPEQRVLFANGAWIGQVSVVGYALWRARWPDKKSPLQLFPSRSPNEDFIGIELIPSLEMVDDSLFTEAQYQALSALLADIQTRYGITLTGSRLVGHEDLDPLSRWDKSGGWDPGQLRAKPYFSWDRVKLPGTAGLVG